MRNLHRIHYLRPTPWLVGGLLAMSSWANGTSACAAQISLQEYLQERYPDEADPVGALLRDTSENEEPLVAAVPNPYAIRMGIGHSAGRSVGVPGSFTTIESFIPLAEEPGYSLLFMEGRAHIDNFGDPAVNIGVGRRFVGESLPAVFGWSAYYDYRRTDYQHDLHQLGLGLELLTDSFEVRANAYLPSIGEERHAIANRFIGNAFHLNRAEVALSGADIEAGIVLPPLGPVQAKVYGGGYFFDDSDAPEVTGWRARLEAAVTENITTGISYQRDDVFGSTVLASITLRSLWEVKPILQTREYPPIDSFRRGEQSHITRSARDRLADPVQRLPFIVTAIDEGDAAINSATSTPFTFLHVVSGATGGDGSFERPYGSLGIAMADGRSGNAIVFTPAGGTFTEDVTMTAGSALWSNAVSHTLSTTLGNVSIPFAGVGQSSPLAAQIVGDVTLANRTELDGFQINGGVRGTGVSQVTVERNVIDNPGDTAILLTSLDNTSSAPLVIQGNEISSALNGIKLVGLTPAPATGNVDIYATISGNTATGAGATGDGIAVEATASRPNGMSTDFVGQFHGSITGNTVNGFESGIRVQAAVIEGTTTNSLASITNNVASSNFRGIQLGDPALGSDVWASITGNTANNTLAQGLRVQGNSFTGVIGSASAGNSFSDTTSNGVSPTGGIFVQLIQRSDDPTGGTFKGDVVNNTTTGNTIDGIYLEALSLAGNVSQNTANQNGRSGIVLAMPLINTQTPAGAISNNTANGNDLDGIAILGPGIGVLGATPVLGEDRSLLAGLIQSNTTNSNQRHGLVIDSFDDVSATVGRSGSATTGGNTANSNGNTNSGTMTGNGGRGIFITQIENVTGAVSGNTASSNQAIDGSGIAIFQVVNATGAVSNNTTSSNRGDGLLIGADQMLGVMANNTANGNDLSGLALFVNTFGGVAPSADATRAILQANTTNSNDRFGLEINTQVINGSLIDNVAQSNGREGVSLRVNGADASASSSSNIFLTRTTLSGNNLAGLSPIPNREFVFENAGSGAAIITFDGNSSADQVSTTAADRQFNFDLMNTGTGTTTPMSLLNNTGTTLRIFGSSDDSVIFLFAN